MRKIQAIGLLLAGLMSLQTFSAFATEYTDGAKPFNRQDGVARLSLQANDNMTSRKYVLGPNDVISVSVYNVPELNQAKIRVQPDGKIFITPLGSIKVAGLSVDDLYDLLYAKYSYYLQEPQISINLDTSRPFIVYVTGGVTNPGSYELDTNTEKTNYAGNSKSQVAIDRKTPLLTNMLVAAGGISYDADLEHVQISNSIDNSKFQVNLLDLIENGNTSQDIYLMAGDTVNVPKLPTPLAVNEQKYKKFASATFSPGFVPVKVFGYVNTPGLVKLDPGLSLDLNSAITSAGGYLQDAAYAPKKVFISRADASGKLVTRVVNPMSNDITLLPNDIVYVPEKARPMAGKAFDYISRIVSPVNSVANSYNNWALMFDPTRYQVVGK